MQPPKTTPLPKGAPTREWLQSAALGVADAYMVNVTPAMAREWLTMNTLNDQKNRRFRQRHARTISLEMRKGEWRLTHQGIAFGTSGRLLDGQHRLWAIVDSNTTQPMLVFVEAEEAGYPNFDRNAPRSAADVLHLSNEQVALASVIINLCARGGGDVARRPMPSEIQAVLAHYAADIEVLNEMSLKAAHRTGRTIAPVKAAWVVRHHNANAVAQHLLQAQWHAFAHYEPRRMDGTTAAGERRLEARPARRGGGGNAFTELCTIGWLMWDPARRGLERILVTAAVNEEFRRAIRADLPMLTPEAEPAGTYGVRQAREASVENLPATRRWTPGADPEMGPQVRAMARAALEAKYPGGLGHNPELIRRRDEALKRKADERRAAKEQEQ